MGSRSGGPIGNLRATLVLTPKLPFLPPQKHPYLSVKLQRYQPLTSPQTLSQQFYTNQKIDRRNQFSAVSLIETGCFWNLTSNRAANSFNKSSRRTELFENGVYVIGIVKDLLTSSLFQKNQQSPIESVEIICLSVRPQGAKRRWLPRGHLS